MHFILSIVLLWNSFHVLFDQQIKDTIPQTQENTIIFFSASWCSYCLLMDSKIWKDPVIMKAINLNYNFISVHQVSKDKYAMEVNGVLYRSNTPNWPTQLFKDVQLYNKEAIFPTLAIIDKKNQIIYMHQGYIKKKELECILSIIEANRAKNLKY